MNTARGFTLLEMAVVVSVIGIVTVIIAPALASFVSSRKLGNAENQALINQKIAQALLDYAAQNTGALPERCTSCEHPYAPVNSTINDDVAAKTGLNKTELNHDGSGGKNARVYQKVDDLSQTLPIYYRSGPEVTLDYQYAVIYSTTSSVQATWQNSNVLPGNSDLMNTNNYNTTWALKGNDYSPYYFSTLPLQKTMMELTIKRLDRLRDALRDYALAKQLQNPSNQNFFAGLTSGTSPNPLNSGANGCKSGAGWYDLSGDAAGVVRTVGLVPDEYGKTAWGAPIHFCLNYIPSGSGGDNPPFYAALRINRKLSAGVAPSNTESGNVVFGF